MAKLTEARAKANKKWDDKNKAKRRLYLYRSHAKTFVRDIASREDLEELRKMIDGRLQKPNWNRTRTELGLNPKVLNRWYIHIIEMGRGYFFFYEITPKFFTARYPSIPLASLANRYRNMAGVETLLIYRQWLAIRAQQILKTGSEIPLLFLFSSGPEFWKAVVTNKCTRSWVFQNLTNGWAISMLVWQSLFQRPGGSIPSREIGPQWH